MGAVEFRKIIDDLGQQFGHLDNRVEKWAANSASLNGYNHQIKQVIADSFEAGSTPAHIFSQAVDMHQSLLEEIPARHLPADEKNIAAGYLNLRFYIYLNGFLQACAESLERAEYNPSLDPAELVKSSYYKPYFFERVTVTTSEAVAMLKDDLERLQTAPRDKKGVVQAIRIRKGVVSTLTESYCPAHPWHYPPVARMDAIKTSADPAVIEQIELILTQILQELKDSF